MRVDGRLQEVTDGHDTAWIRESVLPFSDYAVGSLVPVAFEAYGRILHPAWSPTGDAVRWDRVAAWSGRTMHALAQFEAVARPRRRTTQPPPFGQPPAEGLLQPTTLAHLWAILREHTTAPDDCFVGVWEGCGWLDPRRFDTLRLELPERTHLVFHGPLEAVGDVGWTAPGGQFMPESPSVIWPADSAWYVATDVDQDSTYVGGSRGFILALIADPRLEVWQVAPTDPITRDSDSINSR